MAKPDKRFNIGLSNEAFDRLGAACEELELTQPELLGLLLTKFMDVEKMRHAADQVRAQRPGRAPRASTLAKQIEKLPPGERAALLKQLRAK